MAGAPLALVAAATLAGPFIDPGTAGANTFALTAISRDGWTATERVTYTVPPPPPNRFTLSHKELKPATGVVTFEISVPAAGSVSVVESMLSAGSQFVSGRAHRFPRRRQTVHVTIRPNARGLRLVRHHQKPVSVRLQVTFTPPGGTPHGVRFTLSLK